jgi:phage terminase large subunit
VKVSTGYSPREGQALLHRQLRRFSVLNLHRRWGKSLMCVNEVINSGLRCENKNPFYAYIAQTYSSAERIIWQYLKDYTQHIPNVIYNESKLICTIPRPWKGDMVRIQLYGSERPDVLRGLYFDGIIFDEFAFSNPEAWDKVVRPALADRKGWALIISTPNGRNHFFDIYQFAEKKFLEKDPNWFAATINAEDSGVLDKEELKLIRETIGEEAYQAEFMCSFSASVKGAYYKEFLEKLRDKSQIREVPYNPTLDTIVAFDLGMKDSTVMWFAQQMRDEVRVIDYFEDVGKGLDFYAKVIRDKPYSVSELILPHDAEVRELGTGKSRVEILRSLGFRCRVLKRTKVQDGISVVRSILPRCWFDQKNTKRGVDCLENYKKEWNEKLGTFNDHPLHDWASHGADGFRTLALGIEEPSSVQYKRQDYARYRQADNSYDIFG